MKWQLTYALVVEVDARSKQEARLAGDMLVKNDMTPFEIADSIDLDEPITIVPLDDNGDPII